MFIILRAASDELADPEASEESSDVTHLTSILGKQSRIHMRRVSSPRFESSVY